MALGRSPEDVAVLAGRHERRDRMRSRRAGAPASSRARRRTRGRGRARSPAAGRLAARPSSRARSRAARTARPRGPARRRARPSRGRQAGVSRGRAAAMTNAAGRGRTARREHAGREPGTDAQRECSEESLPRRFPLGGDPDAELEERNGENREPGEGRKRSVGVGKRCRGGKEQEEERREGQRRHDEARVAGRSRSWLWRGEGRASRRHLGEREDRLFEPGRGRQSRHAAASPPPRPARGRSGRSSWRAPRPPRASAW